MTNPQTINPGPDAKQESTAALSVLYVCDFVPGYTAGGPVLLDRLLAEYPGELLTLVSGSQSFKRTFGHAPPKNKWRYVIFPVFSRRGRWGIGRLRASLDWLALPFVVALAWREAKRKRARVILSVAHGQFFLAAAVVSRLTGIPLILWVHDDWVNDLLLKRTIVLKYFAHDLYRFALRSAAHVYAISAPMAEWLRSGYSADSEIQMPAIAVGQGFPAPETTADELRRPFRIAFAGTSTATIETLRILANLIADGSLSQERRVELHLYIPAGYLEDLRAEGIVFHEWLPEAELRQALSAADLLFLPYSFMGNLDHVTSRSFPAKTADYLACGKPILLMAPASAAVVRYARENGFAAIIDQPDSAALRDTILRLIQDSADRARLARNARAVFLENHDIARQRESVYHRIAELSQTRSGSRRS